MEIDPQCDYVVAVVLPYMQLQHEPNSDDMIRDFTVSESHQLYMDKLPLMMNHNDGTTEDGVTRPLDIVGTVEASAVRGADSRMLASIDPTRSEAAMFSSNAVATGIYKDVSLGNTVEVVVRASGGELVYRKVPEEVSLCKRGLRRGSRIERYCPGRGTIERLARHAPEDLDLLVRVHDYERDLSARGVTLASGAEYIDALVALSNERLLDTIEREQLYPRPVPTNYNTMSTTADDQTLAADATKASESAADSSPAAAADADTKAAGEERAADKTAEAAAAAAARTSSAAGTVETRVPETPDVMNAKKMAAEALKAREEAFELRQRLAKAEDAEKRLAAIEAREAAKQKAQMEAIVKSFTQHAAAAKTSQIDVDREVEDCWQMYKTQPERGIQMAERAMRMAVRASENMESLEQARTQKMAEHTNALNSKYFDTIASKFSALNDREMSFVASRNTSSDATDMQTPLDRRFKVPADPAAATMTQQQDATNSSISGDRGDNAVGQKRTVPNAMQQQQQMESAPEPLFVRASENNPIKIDYDAKAAFEAILNETGVIPSFDQVAFNERLVPTGRMKASADGTDVPVLKRQRLRRYRANIEPANFAPEFDRLLVKALDTGPFRSRNARPLVMTSRPVDDVPLPLD